MKMLTRLPWRLLGTWAAVGACLGALALLWSYFAPVVNQKTMSAAGPVGFIEVIQPEGASLAYDATLELHVPTTVSADMVTLTLDVTYLDSPPAGALSVVGQGPLAASLEGCQTNPTPVDVSTSAAYADLEASAKTAAQILVSAEQENKSSTSPADPNSTPWEKARYTTITDWQSPKNYWGYTVDESGAKRTMYEVHLECRADPASVWSTAGTQRKLMLPRLGLSEAPGQTIATQDLTVNYYVDVSPTMTKEQADPESDSTSLNQVSWNTTGPRLGASYHQLEPTVYASSGVRAVFADNAVESDRQAKLFVAGIVLAALVQLLIQSVMAAVRTTTKAISEAAVRRRTPEPDHSPT